MKKDLVRKVQKHFLTFSSHLPTNVYPLKVKLWVETFSESSSCSFTSTCSFIFPLICRLSLVCCVTPPTSLNLKHLRAVYSMSLIHNHIQYNTEGKIFCMLYLIGLYLLSNILKYPGAFRSDDICRCY